MYNRRLPALSVSRSVLTGMSFLIKNDMPSPADAYYHCMFGTVPDEWPFEDDIRTEHVNLPVQ